MAVAVTAGEEDEDDGMAFDRGARGGLEAVG